MSTKSRRKPYFACEEYPDCPDRAKAISRLSDSDGGDDVGVQTSIDIIPVTGRCRGECHHREMEKAIPHSIHLILNGRVVDAGC